MGSRRDTREVPCWCRRGLWALVVASLAACGGEAEDAAVVEEDEDLTIVVEQDSSRIREKEQELQNRRKAVSNERQRLSREREEVSRKLAKLSKKDRTQREGLEKEAKRLAGEEDKIRDRAAKFEVERDSLDKQKTDLLKRISSMTSRSKGGMTIGEREALVGKREKGIAQREKDLAQREADLAAREGEVTGNLKQLRSLLTDLASSGGKAIIMNSSSPASSGPPTRRTAEQSRKDVGRASKISGILVNDLPQSLRQKYLTAVKSLGSKDYSSAQSGFKEVNDYMQRTKVGKNFVTAKFKRLVKEFENRQKSIDKGAKSRLQGLMSQTNKAINGARWDKANRHVNEAFAVLGG